MFFQGFQGAGEATGTKIRWDTTRPSAGFPGVPVGVHAVAAVDPNGAEAFNSAAADDAANAINVDAAHEYSRM